MLTLFPVHATVVTQSEIYFNIPHKLTKLCPVCLQLSCPTCTSVDKGEIIIKTFLNSHACMPWS